MPPTTKKKKMSNSDRLLYEQLLADLHALEAVFARGRVSRKGLVKTVNAILVMFQDLDGGGAYGGCGEGFVWSMTENKCVPVNPVVYDRGIDS